MENQQEVGKETKSRNRDYKWYESKNTWLLLVAGFGFLMIPVTIILAKVSPKNTGDPLLTILIAVFSVVCSGSISLLASAISHKSDLKQHILTAMDHLDTVYTDVYAISQRIQVVIDWLAESNVIDQKLAAARLEELRSLAFSLMAHIRHGTNSWRNVVPDQFEEFQAIQERIRSDPRYYEIEKDKMEKERELLAAENESDRKELRNQVASLATELRALASQIAKETTTTPAPSGFIGATGITWPIDNYSYGDTGPTSPSSSQGIYEAETAAHDPKKILPPNTWEEKNKGKKGNE